jgi:hypothetical protein
LRRRLPLILSTAALLVAVFGATPVGQAAGRLVSVVPFAQKAGYAAKAGNAKTVNGIKAAKKAKPGFLVPLGADGKFPASVGQAGPAGPAGAAGPQGPQGAKGNKGDTGAAGATKVTYVTAVSTGAGNTTATARCAADEVATGGGWYGGTVIISRPTPETASSGVTPNGWTASLTYSGSSQTIYVYAICAAP